MIKLHGNKWWKSHICDFPYDNNDIKFLKRNYFTKHYSWCIPSKDMIKSIVSIDAPILDVGAGSGYLAYLINLTGGTITAIDLKYSNKGVFKFNKNFYKVRRCIKPSTVIELVKKFKGVILLSWPNYISSFAYNVAKSCQLGNQLVYVGEGSGGCNANDQFFDYLLSNFKLVKTISIPQWFGLHDSCEIYRKFKT